MAETLARVAKEILLAYLREVRSLGNEAAKRARFAAVVGELFPGSYAVSEFARGVEKLIRVKTSVGHKRRFVDAYYGNAIIEFERSLNATLAEHPHLRPPAVRDRAGERVRLARGWIPAGWNRSRRGRGLPWRNHGRRGLST